MAETSYFFDAVSHTEGLYADAQARMMRPQGVFLDSPLGTLQVSALNGNLSVTVSAGEAMQSGFYFRNDAPKVLSVLPNTSGVTRTDRVTLRLDRVANTLNLQVIHAANESYNPATIFDFLLATVLVPSGATSVVAGNVVDTRVYSKWPDGAMNTTRVAALEAVTASRVRAYAHINVNTSLPMGLDTSIAPGALNVSSANSVSMWEYFIVHADFGSTDFMPIAISKVPGVFANAEPHDNFRSYVTLYRNTNGLVHSTRNDFIFAAIG